MLFISIGLLMINREIGTRSYEITLDNLLNMLSIFPPVFILIGLMDVWIKRETLIKYMGEGSGVIGVLIAFFIGSVSAGPLYVAFPVAGILMKKGSKFSNVLIFIGAWSTTKVHLILFEASALGLKFALIRLALDLVGIAVIAVATEKLISDDEKDRIYKMAESVND